MHSEIAKKVHAILEESTRNFPAVFPGENYKKEICRYGRKKLVETLVREAELRYQAECVLSDNGFKQNRFGKWECDGNHEKI